MATYALLAQVLAHPVSRLLPLQVSFDLITLSKCGKFPHQIFPHQIDAHEDMAQQQGYQVILNPRLE